jgi:hypothetical protein
VGGGGVKSFRGLGTCNLVAAIKGKQSLFILKTIRKSQIHSVDKMQSYSPLSTDRL